MGLEIERKYLVDLSKTGDLSSGQKIKQAYIATVDKTVVRVRVAGEKAFLTLKGENKGATRSEFEYSVPLEDAESMITELCSGPAIDKTRYLLKHSNHIWELDIFHGDNEGLVVAEVELESETETVDLPDWILDEVTSDSRYYNSNLLSQPFKDWK
ncbi:MAG: CYTH domain-containing protein [Cellvibrionaceae bacterium]